MEYYTHLTYDERVCAHQPHETRKESIRQMARRLNLPLLNELTSHLMISPRTDSQMRKLLTAIRNELVVANGTAIGQALLTSIKALIENELIKTAYLMFSLLRNN